MTSKWTKFFMVPTLFVSVFLIAMAPVSQGMIARRALYSSIVWVESKGNPNAVSKDGAVGIIQIKPVMVKEVNRICKIRGIKKYFTLADRKSTKKSHEMFWIYQEFYHPEIMGDSLTTKQVELLARNWNGGSTGYKKRATQKYWHKVKNRFTTELQQQKQTLAKM